MIARHSFEIHQYTFHGMRLLERDTRRSYMLEVAKRNFANFILGRLSFERAPGEHETYKMTVIISSYNRYLAFKAKVRDMLKEQGVPYLVYEKLTELFKEFETKDDEDNYSTIPQPTSTT